MFRCVKINKKYHIQILVGDKWIVYDPYTADRWDVLVSRIMKRKHDRFCCEMSQQAFDSVTKQLLECSISYIGL